jgi:hypothetical protein
MAFLPLHYHNIFHFSLLIRLILFAKTACGLLRQHFQACNYNVGNSCSCIVFIYARKPLKECVAIKFDIN